MTVDGRIERSVSDRLVVRDAVADPSQIMARLKSACIEGSACQSTDYPADVALRQVWASEVAAFPGQPVEQPCARWRCAARGVLQLPTRELDPWCW